MKCNVCLHFLRFYHHINQEVSPLNLGNAQKVNIFFYIYTAFQIRIYQDVTTL